MSDQTYPKPDSASLTATEREVLDDAMAGVLAAWATGEQGPETIEALYTAVAHIKTDAVSAAHTDEHKRIMTLPSRKTYEQPSGKAVITFYERDLRALAKPLATTEVVRRG